MTRICKVLPVALGLLCLAAFGDGKPVPNESPRDSSPGEFTIDLAPVNKAPGSLDCKITFISQTVKKDAFKRGVTIKGPATEHTAEDATRILKLLFESQKWDVKEMGKTKLLIAGKAASPVAKLEMRVEGLPKEYQPVVTQTKFLKP